MIKMELATGQVATGESLGVKDDPGKAASPQDAGFCSLLEKVYLPAQRWGFCLRGPSFPRVLLMEAGGIGAGFVFCACDFRGLHPPHGHMEVMSWFQ